MTALRLFFFLLLILALPARAELSQHKDRFRIAMEIELQPALLEELVPLFDWDKLQEDIEDGNFTPNDEVWRHVMAGQRLESMLKSDLAHLLLEAARKKPGYPPLKSRTIPGEALHGLSWHRDGRKVEFKFLTPATDPAEYLARVRAFAKEIGMEAKVKDPANPKLTELSFHLHISRADGTNLTRRVEALNRLMLLRLVARGAAKELFDGSRTSLFSDNLNNRGLVRLYENDPSHFELRRHVDDPETELTELLRWLDMPEEAALGEMNKATEALTTTANLRALADLSATGLAIVLAKSKRGLTDPLFTEAIGKLVQRGATKELHALFVHLSTGMLKGVSDAEGAMAQLANLTQAHLKKGDLPRWLTSGPPETVVSILRFSSLHARPREGVFDLKHPKVGAAIIGLVHSEIPAATVNELVRLSAPFNPAVATAGLGLLRNREFQGLGMAFLLESLGPRVLSSEEGWKTVRHILANGDVHSVRQVRREIRSNYEAYSGDQLAEIDAPTRFDTGHPGYDRYPRLPFPAFRGRCADYFDRLRRFMRFEKPPDSPH